MVALNATSALILQLSEVEPNLAAVCDRLQEVYPETAQAISGDVLRIAVKLEKLGVVDHRPEPRYLP